MTERRYSEREVAFILETAAKKTASLPATRSEGLTLTDLQQIGREVGISPDAIADAAANLAAPSPHPPSRLIGTATVSQYERVLPRMLGQDDQSDVLLAIRRRMGRHGITQTVDGGIDWRARDALGGRYVTVESRGGQTRVRVMGNFREGAFVTYTATGTVGAMVSLMALKALGLLATLGPAAAPVIALAGFVPARLLWKHWHRKEDQQLRDTAADIERVLMSRPAADERTGPED